MLAQNPPPESDRILMDGFRTVNGWYYFPANIGQAKTTVDDAQLHAFA